MKPKLAREIAERVVVRLFTNGFGSKAERLALRTADERDLGGWCQGAVRDVVLDVIRVTVTVDKKKARGKR